MWKAPVLMAAMLAAGVCTGYISGKNDERAMIANECRQSSAFTHKRTGFICEVRRATE